MWLQHPQLRGQHLARRQEERPDHHTALQCHRSSCLRYVLHRLKETCAVKSQGCHIIQDSGLHTFPPLQQIVLYTCQQTAWFNACVYEAHSMTLIACLQGGGFSDRNSRGGLHEAGGSTEQCVAALSSSPVPELALRFRSYSSGARRRGSPMSTQNLGTLVAGMLF